MICYKVNINNECFWTIIFLLLLSSVLIPEKEKSYRLPQSFTPRRDMHSAVEQTLTNCLFARKIWRHAQHEGRTKNRNQRKKNKRKKTKQRAIRGKYQTSDMICRGGRKTRKNIICEKMPESQEIWQGIKKHIVKK